MMTLGKTTSGTMLLRVRCAKRRSTLSVWGCQRVHATRLQAGYWRDDFRWALGALRERHGAKIWEVKG